MTKDKLYIKDLRIFEDQWNLKDVILIDNAAHSFAMQINNGIPMLPFYDNKHDVDMIYLAHYLLKLSIQDDVRTILKQTFWMEFLHTQEISDTIGGAIEYTIEELDDSEYEKLQQAIGIKSIRSYKTQRSFSSDLISNNETKRFSIFERKSSAIDKKRNTVSEKLFSITENKERRKAANELKVNLTSSWFQCNRSNSECTEKKSKMSMIEEKQEQDSNKYIQIPSSFKTNKMHKAKCIPYNKKLLERKRCSTIINSNKKPKTNKLILEKSLNNQNCIQQSTKIRRKSFVKLNQKSSINSDNPPPNPESSSNDDNSDYSTEEIIIQTLEEEFDDSLANILDF